MVLGKNVECLHLYIRKRTLAALEKELALEGAQDLQKSDKQRGLLRNPVKVMVG